MYKTLHEKIAQTSRTDIERITFLTDKYSKELKMSFECGVSFLMAEIGYKKYNYIPKNREDLFIIGQLSIKYMRVYAVSSERFIQTLIDCYDYCSKNGYSIEVSQQTLKLEGE